AGEEIQWVQRRVLRSMVGILHSELLSPRKPDASASPGTVALSPPLAKGSPPALPLTPKQNEMAGRVCAEHPLHPPLLPGEGSGGEGGIPGPKGVSGPGHLTPSWAAGGFGPHVSVGEDRGKDTRPTVAGSETSGGVQSCVPALQQPWPEEHTAATTETSATVEGRGGGGEDEGKAMLERAWDLYLKVLDLESSQNSLSAAGYHPEDPPLLPGAELLLRKAYSTFDKAHPDVAAAVAMQDPPRFGRVRNQAEGNASRNSVEDTAAQELQRASTCCNALWPHHLGKGKLAKSKLRLKRPAPTSGLTGDIGGSGPRPRIHLAGSEPRSALASKAGAGAGAGARAGTGTGAATGRVNR
ncbi:unnamed protein product, partial [Discosporangium mesarthrocarpum]